jgi:homospermidine synthase
MGAIQSLPRQWLSQRKKFTKTKWPVYAHIPGPLVLIGFGSIGRGILPLIHRHLSYDKSLFTIIDPLDTHKRLAEEYGIRFLQVEITPENYAEVLTPLLKTSVGQSFCLNLAVNIEARAIMSVCRKVGALYLDADAEPWPDVYFDKDIPAGDRTIYAFRQAIIDQKALTPGGPTAITCCGANPGKP